MADESMYDDGAPATEAPAAPAEPKPSENGNATALIPKSFFSGKRPEVGDECSVKIDRVMEDGVLVSYVPHSEESESVPTPAPAPDDMMD